MSAPRFDGETYDAQVDGERLATQLERVRALMADGQWRPLWEVARFTGGSEAGVSARLRDLRKVRFGAHRVERKRAEGGRWLYRVLPPSPQRSPVQEELPLAGGVR